MAQPTNSSRVPRGEARHRASRQRGPLNPPPRRASLLTARLGRWLGVSSPLGRPGCVCPDLRSRAGGRAGTARAGDLSMRRSRPCSRPGSGFIHTPIFEQPKGTVVRESMTAMTPMGRLGAPSRGCGCGRSVSGGSPRTARSVFFSSGLMLIAKVLNSRQTVILFASSMCRAAVGDRRMSMPSIGSLIGSLRAAACRQALVEREVGRRSDCPLSMGRPPFQPGSKRPRSLLQTPTCQQSRPMKPAHKARRDRYTYESRPRFLSPHPGEAGTGRALVAQRW